MTTEQLGDLWPSDTLVRETFARATCADDYILNDKDWDRLAPFWGTIKHQSRPRFEWPQQSLYFADPPFLANVASSEPGGWTGHDRSSFVSVWRWHLELTRLSSDHRVHDQSDGGDLHRGAGPNRALSQGLRPGGEHRLAHGRAGARVSRQVATDEAATPRCGC